jgi:hypothetical protein
MELFREKLLEALNQISVFIAERFETTTEEQVAFFKNSINNSGTQAFSFLRSSLYSLSEPVLSFNYTGSFSTHTLLSSVIS